MENIEKSKPTCQVQFLEQMAEPLGRIERIGQLRFKARRVIKRRLSYVRNWLAERNGAALPEAVVSASGSGPGLVAGQWVRVKSEEEIRATLDNWNRLKGRTCGFMEEMWPYCGTRQRVLKPVRYFLDETDYRVKKVQRMVFLEGVHCQGTVDYGRCDRNCYFFWREEWLEAIDEQ